MTDTNFSINRLKAGLTPQSLLSLPVKGQINNILLEALQSANPAIAVQSAIQRDGNHLLILNKEYNLDSMRRLYVIAIGKASLPMTQAILTNLGDRLNRAIVLVKEGYNLEVNFHQQQNRIAIFEAGHPIPDRRGVHASSEILELLKNSSQDDLVIFLISGGGSALLTTPVEGITLDEIRELTSALLECGASISEINTIRKHLELLKGGNLAKFAAPARVITLILSDVIGNPLDVIASGPTVADPSTYQDALQILEHYQLTARLPATIISHIKKGAKGEIAETPKPGNPLFERVDNFIIGSNRLTCQAAIEKAKAFGFNSLLLTTFLQGEARQVGKFFAAISREIDAAQQPIARPACVIAGGETTVTIHGKGYGGRNLEVALGSVTDLAGLNNVALLTLATDGGDGPTDAAGAIVTGDSLDRARRLNLAPFDFLTRNDSYNFFEPLGDLLKTGPTQTNVNDMIFLFVY